jgi:hypothetical protein
MNRTVAEDYTRVVTQVNNAYSTGQKQTSMKIRKDVYDPVREMLLTSDKVENIEKIDFDTDHWFVTFRMRPTKLVSPVTVVEKITAPAPKDPVVEIFSKGDPKKASDSSSADKAQIVIPDGMRLCRGRCATVKKIDDFGFYCRGKDKRMPKCKECVNAENKERYRATKKEKSEQDETKDPTLKRKRGRPRKEDDDSKPTPHTKKRRLVEPPSAEDIMLSIVKHSASEGTATSTMFMLIQVLSKVERIEKFLSSMQHVTDNTPSYSDEQVVKDKEDTKEKQTVE